jgi:uncharacterized protein with FMN-binding domain
MATRRLSRSVVALAASAITAVYVAGYAHTQAADASLAPAANVAAAAAAAGAQRPAVTTINPQPTPTARQSSSSAALQSAPALKDGTYTGTGTSRRGDVQVSLTVQSGRVVGVNITGATTQYPTRFIANLPGEVVTRQSAQVDVVGGATYSSLAFRGAVQQALQRAQA